jgi:hypothetical protein
MQKLQQIYNYNDSSIYELQGIYKLEQGFSTLLKWYSSELQS